MTDLPKDAPGAAETLVCGYYTDRLLERMQESTRAHQEAMKALEDLTAFNRTGRLPDARDALLVAAWSGSRVLRADSEDMRGGGKSWARGDRTRDERLAVLRWLDKHGYDIGEVFAAELKEENG